MIKKKRKKRTIITLTKEWDRIKVLFLSLLFWLRYVDETFVIVNDKQKLKSIIEFLNSQHRSIKFTSEEENNNKLPFLDVLLTKKDGKLNT